MMVESNNNKIILSSFNDIKSLSFDNFKNWDLEKNYQGNTEYFTYILLIIKSFYVHTKSNRTIHPKYTLTTVEFEIPTTNGKINITRGMLNCFQEFADSKLARVTKIEKDKLSILKEQLLESENELQKKNLKDKIEELEKSIQKKRMQLPGFRTMLLTADNDKTKLNGLLKNSLHQFFDELPGQNKVADREYKRMRRWVKGGKPDPDVAVAFDRGLAELKLDFHYEDSQDTENKCFQIIVNSQQIYNPEKFGRLEEAVEEVRKIPTRIFEEKFLDSPESWKPYNTLGSLKVLKELGIALGGVVEFYELRHILEEVLKDAHMEYPGSGYTVTGSSIEVNSGSIRFSNEDGSETSGSDLMENTEGIELPPDEQYELQEENFLEIQPYAEAAEKLLRRYQLDDKISMKDFGWFLIKVKNYIMKFIEENPDIKKIDVLDINMYTKIEYKEKPSYKVFMEDLEELHGKLNHDLARIWYYLNEEFQEIKKNLGDHDV